jgi:ethanolamine permease
VSLGTLIDALLTTRIVVQFIGQIIALTLLRRREPDLPRPYRTPGGVATTGVALVLAAAAVVATFLVDVTAALWTLGAYALFLGYFALHSRHHLVASAPEEEFAALAAAGEDVR